MNDAAETKALPKGVTEAQLKKLIAVNGPLYPITVTVDGQDHIALARKPKLAELTLAAGDGKDPVGSGAMMFNTCVVAKDDAYDSNEEVRLAGIKAVSTLFRSLQARVGEAYA